MLVYIKILPSSEKSDNLKLHYCEEQLKEVTNFP